MAADKLPSVAGLRFSRSVGLTAPGKGATLQEFLEDKCRPQ